MIDLRGQRNLSSQKDLGLSGQSCISACTCKAGQLRKGMITGDFLLLSYTLKDFDRRSWMWATFLIRSNFNKEKWLCELRGLDEPAGLRRWFIPKEREVRNFCFKLFVQRGNQYFLSIFLLYFNLLFTTNICWRKLEGILSDTTRKLKRSKRIKEYHWNSAAKIDLKAC